MRAPLSLLVASVLVIVPSSGTVHSQSGSTGSAAFVTIHERPILQNITRTHFWVPPAPDGTGGTIHFSTLESYARGPGEDRFAMYKYDPRSRALSSHIVSGSTEARWQVYSPTYRKYVLGLSLNPQIVLYDPVTNTTEPLFRADAAAWMHQIATAGEYVYAVVSAKVLPSALRGLLKVHIPTKTWRLIPFTDTIEQHWGGAQSVDPAGRVWFYRGYPIALWTYDETSGMQPRTLAGYEDWQVESWDTWGSHFFFILSHANGAIIKKQVDPVTLKLVATSPDVPPAFLDTVPVDLYHQNEEPLRSLYFNVKTNEYFRADTSRRTGALLGRANLGEFKLFGPEGPLLEPQWHAPGLGIFKVLGTADVCTESSGCGPALVVWLLGQKSYSFFPLSGAGTPQITLRDLFTINAPNLSPADILTLAAGPDRALYGSGYLTISDMFRFDLPTRRVTPLEQAIPHGEGEVNGLFTGLDGLLYGVGYPDSVIFRYDPRAPWSPGNQPSNNPYNMGRMGHRNQNVSYRGVQDLDGNVWFESRGEYTFPITFALAKVNFAARTLQVKTDVDDGLPRIDDLAVYDPTHLLLVGHEGNTFKLYVLNQRDFNIEQQFELGRDDGILANLNPRSAARDRLFFASRDMLFRVRPGPSLEPVHRARGDIKKILAGNGDDIFLIGQTFVEKVNLALGSMELWWESATEPVFRNLPYVPAVFQDGVLFIGDREKLRVLTPALSAPTSLVATAAGNTVSLAWTAPTTGAPSTYLVEAGASPGLANLANISTGSSLPALSVSGVPNGTYYVRVRAATAWLTTAPTNEVTLVVGRPGCSSPPAPPTNARVTTIVGRSVTIAWTAPASNVTTYVVDVGSAAGAPDLASVDIHSSQTSVTATAVPSGTFHARIRAANACGTSVPSNEFVVSIP